MPDIQQWDEVAQKLIKLTDDGKLNWNDFSIKATQREEVIGKIFRACIQGRSIAVYEYRFKDYIDMHEWNWGEEVAIEFVKIDGELEWRWPLVPHRVQLLDAIRAHTCGANQFLKDFLAP